MPAPTRITFPTHTHTPPTPSPTFCRTNALPEEAHACIAGAESALGATGHAGPDLFTWRHTMSMLSCFALDALSWALLHEAAEACSRRALPPRLLAAMLGGDNEAHMVDLACNNLCVVRGTGGGATALC